MRDDKVYPWSQLLLCLAVFSACQDEALSPRVEMPDLRPSFELGPGEETWVVEDLSSLLKLGNSSAHSINNGRQITGWHSTSASARVAYVWSPPAASAVDLPTLTQTPYESFGYDINDIGQVVGSASQHAVRWDPGSSQAVQLSEPAGFTGASIANAIGEKGLVAGSLYNTSRMSNNTPAPGVWANGQFTYLELPEGYVTGSAQDINDEVVVGDALGGVEVVGVTDNSRPFYYRFPVNASTYAELDLLPGSTWGRALAINNAGVIVGQSGSDAQCAGRVIRPRRSLSESSRAEAGVLRTT